MRINVLVKLNKNSRHLNMKPCKNGACFRWWGSSESPKDGYKKAIKKLQVLNSLFEIGIFYDNSKGWVRYILCKRVPTPPSIYIVPE